MHETIYQLLNLISFLFQGQGQRSAHFDHRFCFQKVKGTAAAHSVSSNPENSGEGD
jgi:hypothetical protein